MFIVSLWSEHNVPLELPRPTGPFSVGRLGTSWVDTAHVDPFAPPPAHDRELGVWIWYPAQVSDGTPRAEYFPSIAQPPMAELRGAALTHFVFQSLSKVRGHSIENAELAARSQPFPVVLFNPGHGAQALRYATLVEDLASRGYIVVGADRPSTLRNPVARRVTSSAVAGPGVSCLECGFGFG
jgi:predicted dienelactone hydrolase